MTRGSITILILSLKIILSHFFMKEVKPKIVQKEGEEISAEIIAQAIVDIADAMKVFNNSRLTRRAVVTLIHHQSKINKGEIEIVLNNLQDLAKDWLK